MGGAREWLQVLAALQRTQVQFLPLPDSSQPPVTTAPEADTLF